MNQLVYRLSLGALLGSLLAAAPALAQGVGIGTTTPNAAAALDIAATATGKGLLIPRLDSATRVAIPSPPTGLLVFQVGSASPRTRTGFYYYGGGSWLYLPDKASSGDNLGNGVATTDVNLQANALVGTGASIGTAVGVGVRADGGLNLGQNAPGTNILLGYQAGQLLTPGTLMGNNSLLVGYQAGMVTTTGRLNQFVGYQAGISNTTGTNNQFEGYRSGNNNTTGNNNQFSGLNAGYANTTGNNNTFSGYQSGVVNTTGSKNTGVGYGAGPSTGSLTNAAAFGYNAQVSQSNSLVLGGTGADAVSVGIGTTTPTATLDVAGSARLRGLTTAGFVATDANGNLSSTATVPGDNLGNGVATTTVNLQSNALVGSGANISSAVGVGVRADGGLNLGQNTTGNNVYLGYQAGAANTTGSNNTFSGFNSGKANTAGGGNTLSGRESGNITTTGNNNAFYGFGAGDQNTTGSGNVFVGQSAGQVNATGSNNVALGTNSGPNVSGLSNTVALGYNVKPTQSNTVILGSNASVGIGTTTPSSTLQVNGSLAVGVARNVAGGPASSPVPLSSQGYYGLLPTNSNGSQDVYQLPAPGAVPGRLYYLRNLSTTNTAYLTTPSGTDIFDGGSNIPSTPSNFYTMSPSGGSKSVTAISDGVIWVILRSDN